MEAIGVIQIIDNLKTILVEKECQEALNVWKRQVVESDIKGEFNYEEFKRSIKVHEVITRMLKNKLK
jgi:hypothetical protein